MMWTRLATLISIFCLLVVSVRVSAADSSLLSRTLCVWDLMGANGDNFSLMKDYRLAAKDWGVNLKLKAYSDEKIATEDFRVGQCDAVVITGLRAKPFNTFAGSLESIGSIPTYRHLKMVVGAISSPKASALMSQGAYEVAGVVPLGSAYLFLRDRSIDEVGKLAGKKFAVFDYDRSQSQLVQGIGAQAVPSDISNFATKFNNGVVDVIAAPATAYRPLELYRGLGDKGGIPDFLVAQVFLQVVLRKEKFPEGFGQKSRTYILDQFDRVLTTVQRYEKDIDPKYWLHIPDADRPRYVELMRQARIKLTKDNIYDKRMMSLLKRVRCQIEPANAECADGAE